MPILHYDGTPITARFIVQAIGDRDAGRQRATAAGRPGRVRRRHDLPRQAEAAPPHAARESRSATRGATTKARSRRCAPAAATTRSRRRSSRPAGNSTIEPHRVAKLSGIGCSSKTPDYFLGNSHGFNTVHGRMPSVLTGANLANRDLLYLGVSGDGDSASIGLGQFAHADAARRQHDLHRREQRRLRPDQGPVLGHRRPGLEVQARRGQHATRRSTWCRWRCSSAPPTSARGFSGDKEQLVPLIKGALSHRGAALHRRDQPLRRLQQPRRQHQELRLRARPQRGGEPARLHAAGATRSPPMYAPGEVIEITQHDGSRLRLRKLADGYDPGDRLAAMSHITAHQARGEVVTGLLFVDPLGRRPARSPQHRRHAPEPARRSRALPRRRGARSDQRRADLTRPQVAFSQRGFLLAGTPSHGLGRDCDRSMSPGPLQSKLSPT